MKNVLIFVLLIGLTVLFILIYQEYPSAKSSLLIAGLILITLSIYYTQIKKGKKQDGEKLSD